MKKIKVFVGEGEEIEINGEELMPGLFLHKFVKHDNKLTEERCYTLSVNGFAIEHKIYNCKKNIKEWVKDNLSEFNFVGVKSTNDIDAKALCEKLNLESFNKIRLGN